MININEDLITNKYIELKENKKTEDILDSSLGNLMIFINKKPNFCLFGIKINDDFVYIGSEKI